MSVETCPICGKEPYYRKNKDDSKSPVWRTLNDQRVCGACYQRNWDRKQVELPNDNLIPFFYSL
jgi:hypothetical protein